MDLFKPSLLFFLKFVHIIFMMCFLSMHMSLLQDGEGSGDEDISDEDSSDDEIDLIIYILKKREMDRRRACMLAAMIGTYYLELYSNKAPRRVAPESGHDWVMRTLANRTACYNMFRMHRPVFERLHSVLVESYELKSTNKMDSMECLGLFFVDSRCSPIS